MQKIAILIYLVLRRKTLAAGETRQFLDDASLFFDGHKYPSSHYDKITSCFDKYGDARILKSQDAAWRKFYDMWQAGGAPPDEDGWNNERGGEWLENRQNSSAYFGRQYRKYLIYEPCNYASNFAMYTSAIRVCEYENWNIPQDEQNALVKTFAALGVSSAWFHGSMTSTGGLWDVASVSLAIKNAYQIATRSINTNSSIFLTASNTSEPTSLTRIVDQVALIALDDTLPLSEWRDYFDSIPFEKGRIEQNSAAYLAFTCSLALPFSVCQGLIDLIAPVFLSDEEQNDFFLNLYMPELKKIAENEGFPMPFWRGLPILKKGFGVFVGMLWGFTFQENTVPTPCLEGCFIDAAKVGTILDPVVNLLAFMFHGTWNSEKKGYNGREEYPGAKQCNRKSPHAFWHQIAADGLFELFALADETERVLTKRQAKKGKQGYMSDCHFLPAFPGLRGRRDTNGNP